MAKLKCRVAKGIAIGIVNVSGNPMFLWTDPNSLGQEATVRLMKSLHFLSLHPMFYPKGYSFSFSDTEQCCTSIEKVLSMLVLRKLTLGFIISL